jgi:DNA-directed RNA polymerase subunit K/omega|tara:strand:+ start:12327 stop:12629 length:303 start_codon:yes stop_codon:yes gene_type:complete
MKEYIMALKTLSIRNMEEKTSDIFEAVVIMSKRAKQILNNRIVEEIITSADEEELEMGVYDQIEEKNPEDYEELEKVTSTAVNEFVDGDIKWSIKEKNNE